jgi:hypothetical protein
MGMELDLRRVELSAICTIGELYVDGEFECYTLEDAVRDRKIPGETAIPPGRYQVVLNWSPRFKRILPLLVDVPGFEGVRIHPGNTAADTEGCILVGRVRGASAVFQSRDAFDALFLKLEAATIVGREIWIEVRNVT